MQPGPFELDPQTREFYVRTLAVLTESRVPFLVGGAFALATYTGIERHTKDMDLFTRKRDLDRVLDALTAAGFRTEVPFPHWLAKAHGEGCFVDVIYSSGNGVCEVDDEWFAHAMDSILLGTPVDLCPPEEMIWSKSYVMERERYDGADIVHLIRAAGHRLDWHRVLRRFGPHWRVLLAHLILFGFVYPSEQSKIPDWVMKELTGQLRQESESPPPRDRLCNGTFLSREQYLIDVREWGLEDARLPPEGSMTPDEVTTWTNAIDQK